MSQGPEEIEDREDVENREDLIDGGAFALQVSRVLGRQLELPAGFADRVVAAAARQESAAMQPEIVERHALRGKLLPFRAWRLVGGGAIAAALLAGVFATEEVHESRDRARRQVLATQQFETASRITDQALAHTREQLERAGAFRAE